MGEIVLKTSKQFNNLIKLMDLFIVKWIFSIFPFPASGFILSLTILPKYVGLYVDCVFRLVMFVD